MATYKKTSARFNTGDWFTANYSLVTNAERERGAAHDTRQESRFLRNETNNRTKWDQLDNNARLDDRVSHIKHLKVVMEWTLDKLDHEITGLSDAKDEMELALVAQVNLANHINIENLVLREGRQDIEVVEDEVEDQLFKERELLEAIKLQLQAKIDEAFEHLCVLQDVRKNTLANLQDKNITMDIDVDQYNLTDDSAGITFKPDATRVPKGTLTVQQWEDFCLFNQTRADTEIANSVRIREAIHQTMQQTANDLLAQHTATAFALRKRIHEQEMALDELQWQKKQTEEEIAEVEAEINRLQNCIRYNNKVTKVAQTRLENRINRPSEEMCHDNVQFGLTDESKQLDASLKALEDKLRQAQHALDCLEKNLHRINQDIQNKTTALHIDRQCLASRVKMEPAHPLTVTERNMTIVGGSREKGEILAF